MSVCGLSPDAHGTLQALDRFRAIRFFDWAAAAELTAHGYAEIRHGRLVVSESGHTAAEATRRPRSFGET